MRVTEEARDREGLSCNGGIEAAAETEQEAEAYPAEIGCKEFSFFRLRFEFLEFCV